MNTHSRPANNWYVIIGASCAGKTSLVSELERRGYTVVHESARHFIDQEIQKGKTIQDIRKDERLFQQHILEMKINIEKGLNAEELTFFDRGIPDTQAFWELYNFPPNPLLEESLRTCSYKKVFLLEKLPYAPDAVRVETEEQQNKLHDLLEKAYRACGFPIMNVPAIPLVARADFILKNL